VPAANPVADGLSASELAYDAHGNTTTFADQALVFDVANRHMSTTITAAEGTTTITYLRDAGNRIVSRTVDAPGTENDLTTRYAHTGSADVSGLVVDALGAITEYTVSLPRGAAARFVIAGEAQEQWTYPNMLGSVIVEADGEGVRVGAVVRYDPWGQPIDPVTGRIGTSAADDAVIDNAPGDADYAFVGGHRKLYEHQGTVAVVQMGARVYVPSLGRFLSVDPVEGGVTNAYDYPADPVNKLDLTGKWAQAVLGILLVAAVVIVRVLISVAQRLLPRILGRNPTTVSMPRPPIAAPGSRLVAPPRTDTQNQNRPIPFPAGPSSYSYRNNPHIVYVISPVNVPNDVWKYGISHVGESRPLGQISACEEHFNDTCRHDVLHRDVPTWEAARWLEARYVESYAAEHDGFCPPGQPVSCR
jgi:RHS repeat-associated protein